MNRDRAIEAYSRVQYCLSDALKYWLYNSTIEQGAKNAVGARFYIYSQPIKAVISSLQDANVPFQKQGNLKLKISLNRYSEVLASLYCQWEKYLPETSIDVTALAKGKTYHDWLNEGGRDSCYRQAHKLRKLIKIRGAGYFERAIIHGSVATLDAVPGFSDMDLAFVVKSTVLKTPDKLLQLRKLACKITSLTFAFDPFMHHGPYYISEIDLGWYAEAMFPSVLFAYGVNLIDDSPRIEIMSRPARDYTDKMMEMFYHFFQRLASKPFYIECHYDFEWVLGSVMLLPTLYLQQKTGTFRYKRDTFILAEKDFLPKEWEPVRIATELRYRSEGRYNPHFFLALLAFHLRWPGLLIKRGSKFWNQKLSLQQVNDMLGNDFPSRTLHLIDLMRGKLQSF